MKILCLYKPNGEEFRLRGFANALSAAGHEFKFFRFEDQKPILDIFYEYRPDVFIGTTFDLPRALLKCFERYPETYVMLKGSNWGPIDEKIDKSVFPVVTVTDEEKHKLAQLKKLTGKPDIVFCHYHPNRVEETMSGWNEIGIKPIGLMNAADTVAYGMGKFRPELKSDISFVGGYWGYKGKNLDSLILPSCHPVGKVNIKIWGNQPWPVPQYMGWTNNENVRDIYASAFISPSVSEPHSLRWGFDVIERPFKVISSGGFCISDDVSGMLDAIDRDEMVNFHYGEELVDFVHFFRKNPELRQEFVVKGRKKVYGQHTYFHRMAYLFDEMNLSKEAAKLLQLAGTTYYPKDIEHDYGIHHQ